MKDTKERVKGEGGIIRRVIYKGITASRPHLHLNYKPRAGGRSSGGLGG